MQYINGLWLQNSDSGKTFDLISPATEKFIEKMPFGGRADAEKALAAAEKARPIWAEKNPYQRADILKNAAQIIRENSKIYAEKTALECGKPLAEARGEWSVAAQFFEWMAEESKRTYGHTIPSSRSNKRMQVIFQPIGVVAVITAWNFPAYNTARVWAAALAAGCPIVCKPSEFTPSTAICMIEALEKAGLPAGCANLVLGDANEIGQAFLDSKICRKIHFVGSTRVGKLLMDGASKTSTRLSLELGGNAPAIIFGDVDVEKVAASAVTTKFRNAGQVCISPQRFLVHESIFEQFCAFSADFASKITVGEPFENPTPTMGPLINARQLEHVERIVQKSIAAGAKLLTGGKRPANRRKGHFFEPTVLKNPPIESPAFQDEIFGPIMPIRSFSTMEEALEIANSTDAGLASYVWTNDLRTATLMAERLEFGMVGVNDWAPHATEAPFIGWKSSGLGAEGGAEGIREYLEKKLIGIGI